jgi:anti-sigma regulatory factor (Ser/Thr protein kinase)
MTARLQRAASAAELATFGDFLQAFWIDKALPPAAAFPFELALEEILLNVATHGRPVDGREPSVEVRLDWDGKAVRMVILDDGLPFDPLSRDPPDVDAPLEDRPVGGLGVHLVRTLMDDVAWRHVDGRNELTLTCRLDKA